MTRALISGNCLRYDIAAQLAAWIPGLEVVTDTLPDLRDTAAIARLRGLLANTDLWITMASADACAVVLSESNGPTSHRPTVCRIPIVGFAAFHPDICFAIDNSTGQATRQIFNSAIAVWAYQHELPVSEAATLYTAERFRALGYLDAWPSSVAYLKQAFAASDLADDFSKFFYAVKRAGCFMQAFNHPTPSAIATLCVLICQRAGLKPVSLHPLPASNSPASRLIWPVYPAIAQRLGMGPGSYVWQIDGVTLQGVSEFLTWMFKHYQAQGIAPGQLRLVNRNGALMDRVLGQPPGQIKVAA